MTHVKDFKWHKQISTHNTVSQLEHVGFQGTHLAQAVAIISKMKMEGVKIYLTFTSNMVTSGLRGFFAQLISLGMVDVIVTTIGGLEEDMMKASKEQFVLGAFTPDDIELHEQGINRVGNIFIRNESYEAFENILTKQLHTAYEKQARWTPSELFSFLGSTVNDTDSILYQAHKHNVPIFCPAITDGAFGFHLFMVQQKHNDFVIDVVQDFKNILFTSSHDDKKGLISLGGSISKHHAILSCLLNGGVDYAVYMTTARSGSGSMSGATTDEAKSWGKVKYDSDVTTVLGDVTITFPLVMCSALDKLNDLELLKNGL